MCRSRSSKSPSVPVRTAGAGVSILNPRIYLLLRSLASLIFLMTLNMFRQINQWFSISLPHISDSLWNIFDWIFQYSLKFNRLDLSNPLSHFLYRWYHFLKKRSQVSQFALGLIMKSTFGSSLFSLSVLPLLSFVFTLKGTRSLQLGPSQARTPQKCTNPSLSSTSTPPPMTD